MNPENNSVCTTIDEYIQPLSPAVQEKLQALRQIVLQIAPEATEKISWGMPTFMLNGILIQFAAHKEHIGLYPGPVAIEHFADKLSGYKTSKGTIQLPFDQPIPKELVEEIVRYRLEQNKAKKI